MPHSMTSRYEVIPSSRSALVDNLAANAVNKLDHALEKIGRMMVDTSPRLITSSEAVVLFNSLVKILE